MRRIQLIIVVIVVIVELKSIVIFDSIFVVFQKVFGFLHLLIICKEELLICVDTVY